MSDRISAIKDLFSVYTDRRSALKAAAAAGLIPVLASSRPLLAQDATPKQGGTITLLGHQEISSLSPEDSGPTVQWVPISNIMEGLYAINEQYELEPVLADSYEPSEDGLTYTFKLKSGVTFHNGDAFTSADVLYTYEWIMDEASASTRSAAFELVEKVEAPDDTTVVITLKEADVTFMVNVGTVFIYPKDYHAEHGEDHFKANPVGTGAYKLEELNPQQRCALVAYDDYYRGRANIDKIHVDVVPEAAGRMSALETGAADNSIWGLNAEDNVKLTESGKFLKYETVQVAVNHFPLNNEHEVLSDKNVRKALLMAIDRQQLADDVFLGQAQVAHTNLSPAIAAYYNSDVPHYDFDPDAAKAMLDEAGWVEGSDGVREKDGVKAAFTLMVIQGDTQRRPEAEVAQIWWQDIGVEVELQEGIVTDILNGMRDGTYDAALFNWTYGGSGGDPDARGTLGSDGTNNFSRFFNDEVDQLLQDGIRELDQAKRVEIYKRIQEIVVEEVPFLYLLNLQNIVFYANRVKGLPAEVLNADNLYPKIYQLWLDDEA